MSKKSIVEQLEISPKEVQSTVVQVNYMIKVMKEGKLSDIQINKIHGEWMTIAKRLKKGKAMLEKVELEYKENPSPALSKRIEVLVSLYSFLLHLLGFYDLYFKRNLEKGQHKRLQMEVLHLLE